MTDQQLGFDVVERNTILDRALAGAGDAWQQAALHGLASLAGTGVIFQATDLIRAGVPEPNHPARWGALFAYGSKVGLIERVGYAPSARSTVRGSVASTWRGAGAPPAPEGPPVKAISLSRPWSALVATGRKPIENRTWNTTHRGLLVIHAAKSWDGEAYEVAREADVYGPSLFAEPEYANLAHAYGYIGVAELVEVCHADRARPGDCNCLLEPATARWAYAGHYHWRLINAHPFDLPIPGRGRLGMWTPPLDVIQAARRAAASDRLERTA